MSEYVTIYTDTGPVQVRRDELESKYAYNEQTRRWEPKNILKLQTASEEEFKTLASPREGTIKWIDDNTYMRYEGGAWRLYSKSGEPVKTEDTPEKVVIYSPSSEQGSGAVEPEKTVAERFSAYAAGIPLTIPYVVQKSELEKIMASGRQLYYIPLEGEAVRLASSAGAYILQQRTDFIGFSEIEGKPVAVFSKNIDDAESVIRSVKASMAKEAVSSMSGAQKAATIAMMFSQPEGYRLAGSIVSQKVGLPVSQTPEEIVFEKMENIHAQHHDILFYIKSGAKSLISPAGMPVAGYAGGVVSQASLRIGKFTAATMMGVSAAMAGTATAFTIVDAMHGRYENVLGNVFAFTQAGLGYSVGALHTKDYIQSKEIEYATKTLHNQLKGSKFSEVVNAETIKGKMIFRTLDEVKSTTFVHDMARSQSHMITKFGKPDYWMEGFVDYHGKILRSDEMSSIIGTKYDATTIIHFDRWWGKGAQIDIVSGKAFSSSKILLKQPGETFSISVTRSGSNIGKSLSDAYDLLDDLKYVRFITDKNVFGYGFSRFKSGTDVFGTGNTISATTTKTSQSVASSIVQNIKPNVEVRQVRIMPPVVASPTASKMNVRTISAQRQSENTLKSVTSSTKILQNIIPTTVRIKEDKTKNVAGVAGQSAASITTGRQMSDTQNTIKTATMQMPAISTVARSDTFLRSSIRIVQKMATDQRTPTGQIAPPPSINVIVKTPHIPVFTPSIVSSIPKSIVVKRGGTAPLKSYKSRRIYKPSIYAYSFKISGVKTIAAKDIIRPLRWFKR